MYPMHIAAEASEEGVAVYIRRAIRYYLKAFGDDLEPPLL